MQENNNHTTIVHRCFWTIVPEKTSEGKPVPADLRILLCSGKNTYFSYKVSRTPPKLSKTPALDFSRLCPTSLQTSELKRFNLAHWITLYVTSKDGLCNPSLPSTKPSQLPSNLQSGLSKPKK